VVAGLTLGAGVLDRAGSLVEAAAPAHRYAIITDDRVGPLYAERLVASFARAAGAARSIEVLTIPAGETAKTRATWAELTDTLLDRGVGRDSTVIALGGGVVGDLAGFVAATYLRGVPVVQIPTTLLAMIDAAIGGKTGVDTPAGKNLVGAFHSPAATLVDPTVLATLPTRQLAAGLAEAIKHGAVADAAYFARVRDDAPMLLEAPGAATGPAGAALLALIARSIEIKSDVVARDARESGVRKILNFGHTLGHALETESGYTLLHGEAVAIGMALEAQLAELAAIAECGVTEEICRALDRATLPSALPPGVDADAIVRRTHADKKARAGEVAYALPQRIGRMAGADKGWAIPLSDAFVRGALS
jgi:3-dehydroquinate synthase